MDPMTSSIPDDATWEFLRGGAATLPPAEVLAIYAMIAYLNEQFAGCHAASVAPH